MQVICCQRPHTKPVVLYRSAKDTGQLTHNVLYSSVTPPQPLLQWHVAFLHSGLLLSALSSEKNLKRISFTVFCSKDALTN